LALALAASTWTLLWLLSLTLNGHYDSFMQQLRGALDEAMPPVHGVQ